MAIPGLQDYRADSEISDSEGEISPSHSSLTVTGLVSSGLGIPPSKQEAKTPPIFVPPKVQSAPSISLVGYGDEEEGGGDEDMNTSSSFETTSSQPLPQSLISLISRHDNTPSIEALSDGSSTPESTDEEPLFFCLNEIELPPEPSGKCSEAQQQKIANLLKKKYQLGVSPYDVTIKSKSFRNPSIYEKLIQLCELDEFGTNYEKEAFDPKEWKKEDYYERLAEAQKKAHENKQKSRGKIEFKSGTKVTPPAPAATATVKPAPVPTASSSGSTGSGLLPVPAASVTAAQDKKRRSKWDNPSNEQKKSNSCGGSPTNVAALAVGAQALINARLIDKNLMKLFKS